MRILVTGANGFVGRRLLERLDKDPGINAVSAVRQPSVGPAAVPQIPVGDISASTNWEQALRNCDAVVHTAARVHIMRDKASDPLAEFRRVNLDGTINLARQASRLGVRRFIFLSSAKVYGERSKLGSPIRIDDDLRPTDPYSVSKVEAERALGDIASTTGLEVVIIRPVMIYGPNAKGNFRAMLRWLDSGIPLPLGSVNNRRSILALDNLIDFTITCLHHPAAAGQAFLVSDGDAVSTTQLLRRTAAAMHKQAYLIPLPEKLLLLLGKLTGKEDVVRRLLDSLEVDISKTRELLGWQPPVPMDVALRRAVESFNPDCA